MRTYERTRNNPRVSLIKQKWHHDDLVLIIVGWMAPGVAAPKQISGPARRSDLNSFIHSLTHTQREVHTYAYTVGIYTHIHTYILSDHYTTTLYTAEWKNNRYEQFLISKRDRNVHRLRRVVVVVVRTNNNNSSSNQELHHIQVYISPVQITSKN